IDVIQPESISSAFETTASGNLSGVHRLSANLPNRSRNAIGIESSKSAIAQHMFLGEGAPVNFAILMRSFAKQPKYLSIRRIRSRTVGLTGMTRLSLLPLSRIAFGLEILIIRYYL